MIALYENLNRQEVKKKKSSSSSRLSERLSERLSDRSSERSSERYAVNSSIKERANSKARALLQKLIDNREIRKQHKADKLALNQLIQLDDALLKDMGISRSELDQVRRGTLSFDALIKHQITSVRDNSGNSQPPQNISH